MRAFVICLCIAGLLVGVQRLAQSEDGTDSNQLKTLRKRLDRVTVEVEYLRARERMLTSYILQNAERADGLDKVATDADEKGFTKRAIPPNSRQAILDGMRALAKSLRQDLPTVDTEQQAILKRLDALK
jgi:hypothetical protein